MKKSIYLLFLIILMVNCRSNKNTFDEKIALQIGELQFTDYEVEKNINLYKGAILKKTGRQPNENELKQWEQEFINRAYILADAYHKGYDTTSVINKRVSAMAHFIVSQPDGLLEHKLIDDSLNITDAEISTAKLRWNKKIEVQYLKFSNYDSAVHFLGTKQIKSVVDFNNAVRKSPKHNYILYKKEVLAWPLIKMWEREEYLFSLQKGDITPLMEFNDGFYLMLIDNIEYQNNLPGTFDVRTQIERALKSQKKEKILSQIKKEIMKNSQITYNTDVLKKISKVITPIGELEEFDKNKFTNLLNLNIAKYKIDNNEISVSFNNFIDYYNELPMRFKIENIDQLLFNLNAMVLQEAYFRKAEKLGLTTQRKFLLDKENFKKNTIYLEYENNELKKQLTVSDKEIETYYELGKTRFVQATNSIVTIYVLDTREKAFKVFGLIRRGVGDTSRLFLGIAFQNIQKHVNISFNSKNYPDTLVKSITNLKIKEVTMPFQLNGNFYVVYKENEFGSRTRELNEVKPIIRKEIENKKLNQAKNALLLKLKTCYSIKGNIDIKKHTVGQHE